MVRLPSFYGGDIEDRVAEYRARLEDAGLDEWRRKYRHEGGVSAQIDTPMGTALEGVRAEQHPQREGEDGPEA